MIERNPPKGKPRARQPRAGSIVANKTQHRAAAAATASHTHTLTHTTSVPENLNLHHALASELHGISAYPAPVQ